MASHAPKCHAPKNPAPEKDTRSRPTRVVIIFLRKSFAAQNVADSDGTPEMRNHRHCEVPCERGLVSRRRRSSGPAVERRRASAFAPIARQRPGLGSPRPTDYNTLYVTPLSPSASRSARIRRCATVPGPGRNGTPACQSESQIQTSRTCAARGAPCAPRCVSAAHSSLTARRSARQQRMEPVEDRPVRLPE